MAILQTSIAMFVAHVFLLLGLPAALVAAAPLSPASPLTPVTHELVGSSSNSADSDFWVAKIKRQGTVPFGGSKDYKVFRNVRDFGAKGKQQEINVKRQILMENRR